MSAFTSLGTTTSIVPPIKKNHEIKTSKRPIPFKWDAESDALLSKQVEPYLQLSSTPKWSRIAHNMSQILGREVLSKQARSHWLDVLDPSLSRSKFTDSQTERIRREFDSGSHCWAKLAKEFSLEGAHFSENKIKNYAYSSTRVKKRRCPKKPSPDTSLETAISEASSKPSRKRVRVERADQISLSLPSTDTYFEPIHHTVNDHKIGSEHIDLLFSHTDHSDSSRMSNSQISFSPGSVSSTPNYSLSPNSVMEYKTGSSPDSFWAEYLGTRTPYSEDLFLGSIISTSISRSSSLGPIKSVSLAEIESYFS